MIRLNKYMADCGVGSRRSCDKIIAENRVKVNRKPVSELGYMINEFNDTVTVDGKKITPKNKNVYIILHKPKGYVTTVKDEKGRKTVMELLPEEAGRVYPVGRLDYDTEGLLLFTDDGDLAFRITHPRNEITKTYLVKVEGSIGDNELNRLRAGVELDGKLTGKSKVKVVETDKQFTKLHVTINEGRNRQVRRMFEAVGKQVDFLKRIRIGDLGLGSLERGKVRRLTDAEVFYLSNL